MGNKSEKQSATVVRILRNKKGKGRQENGKGIKLIYFKVFSAASIIHLFYVLLCYESNADKECLGKSEICG